MADIFISHQREDREQARVLADSLDSMGFTIWWDFKMRAGEAFRDSIEAMLRACKVVIVLWSPRAVQSRFVRSEASRAQQMGKFAPVLIAHTDLPLGLDEVHAADLTNWRGEVSDQNFQALLRDLEIRIGRPALLAARSAPKKGGYGRAEARSPSRSGEPRIARPRSAKPNRGRLAWLGATALLVLLVGAGMHRSRSLVEDAAHPGARATALDRQARTAPVADLVSAPPAPMDFTAAPRSHAALLAAVEGLPFDGRGAYAQARRDFAVRDRAGPFGLQNLHPSVRRAVRQALRASAFADAAAARARIAALRAEDAARLASAGAPGTIIEDVGDRHWATEWANDAHNGFGILAYRDGDRYAGAWRDGRLEGPGVFNFEDASDRAAGLLRYEGDFAAGRRSGAGILMSRNGERYSGALAANAREGAGVFSYANGERYEGEWRAGLRDGLGVLWSARGAPIQAGLWRRDRLMSVLAPEE